MPPQNQPPSLQPNDLAANLALATHISTQLAAPQQPQQDNGLQELQDAHQAPDLTPIVQQLQQQVAALTKKVAQEPQNELAEIRQMVEQAIAEPDANDGKQS